MGLRRISRLYRPLYGAADRVGALCDLRDFLLGDKKDKSSFAASRRSAREHEDSKLQKMADRGKLAEDYEILPHPCLLAGYRYLA